MNRFGAAAAWLLTGALVGAAPGVALAQQAPTGPNISSVRAGMPGVSYVKTKMPLFAYSSPTEQSSVIDEVVGQTVLPTTGCANGWCRIVLSRAAPSYIRQNLLDPVTPQH